MKKLFYSDSSSLIYQVFIRNYSVEGTINALNKDLERIKDLGVDVLYLLPIFVIGEEKRKGTYGSPYAIKDYLEIAKDLGNKKDLKDLIEKAHSLNLKIIVDMVFNHCSPDNQLTRDYPHWFLQKDGKIIGKIKDWSDVVDFDYSKKEVTNYLIEVLKYWTIFGFDGFRFDVSSLIPIEFFIKAKKELQKINKNIFFLGEAVEYSFINYLRRQGYTGTSDAEAFTVFDGLYNYNHYPLWLETLKDKNKLITWTEQLNQEENIYARKALRLTSLENHDQLRIANRVQGSVLKTMTALSFFLRGIPFIYAGQEFQDTVWPPLFEKQAIKRETTSIDDENFLIFIKTLINLRKTTFVKKDLLYIDLKVEDYILIVTRVYEKHSLKGYFNLYEPKEIILDKSKKSHINLLTNEKINSPITLINPIIISI
ncbi:MAG: hypothetical protein LBM99_03420 [Bacillales bacterium]|jgi:glycosidase|nr:hypothetical protein [Bacillales bacterium]